MPMPAGSRYVAMGSGLAAGPGLPSRVPGSPRRAGRSTGNYAHLVAREPGSTCTTSPFPVPRQRPPWPVRCRPGCATRCRNAGNQPGHHHRGRQRRRLRAPAHAGQPALAAAGPAARQGACRVARSDPRDRSALRAARAEPGGDRGPAARSRPCAGLSSSTTCRSCPGTAPPRNCRRLPRSRLRASDRGQAGGRHTGGRRYRRGHTSRPRPRPPITMPGRRSRGRGASTCPCAGERRTTRTRPEWRRSPGSW